jgi:hypothetical protein
MGDFNTLSRHDQAQHRDARLADMLLRTDHTVTHALMNCGLFDSCGSEWRTPSIVCMATEFPLCVAFHPC